MNSMQVTSWIILTLLAVGTFISALPLPVYPSFQVVFAISVTWIVVCIVYATSTDPGIGQDIVPVNFDRKKNAHVIEKGFCNICRINV